MDSLSLEKKYCSQGDTSGKHNPKKIFSSQNGCFLYDNENIPHLDMQMFNSAANFGYKNKIYSECLNNSKTDLLCLSGEFLNNERISLSSIIGRYMENKHNAKGRVHFTVGGAQAVDDALKLAFNYTTKSKIFAFECGYHGRTMASSSISASYRYTKQFGSIIDTQRIPFPNCWRCAYGKCESTCGLYCIKQFERLFENEFCGLTDSDNSNTSVAAFIFEPVLGRGGYVFPHKKYFYELTKILRRHNILIIADEVQMGFYRTGTQWSFEHYEIVPDIIVFGKAIANGIWPLAGVWAKEDIISPEIWPSGSTHCTFASSPLAMSLGLTTFNLTSTLEFSNRIIKGAAKFKEIILQLKNDYPFIGRAQVKGHAAGLDIINSTTKKLDGVSANQLVNNALTKPIMIDNTFYGLILTSGGPHNSSLMLSPSLYITEDELNLFDSLIRANFKKIFH